MKDIIRKFIIKRFLHGEGSIEDGESLFGSGIVDSLKLLELIAFVEKTFDISVNMSEVTVENFDSLDNISELIKTKRGALSD